jgi:malate dehydrogenase (oxaloacetate-decarboxylating)
MMRNMLIMDSVGAHRRCRGKIEIMPKCDIRGYEDLSVWYTPGVADACMAIKKNREEVFELTNRWNTLAIVTDGTRVLGLGDIGPEAALPVMEGKALLFKYLGGIDAVPICLKTRNADEIVRAAEMLAPSFGGINLEDIESPKCFHILDRLRTESEMPVWHDDQQGTATAVVAGLMNALKVTGRRVEDARIVIVGAGAAGVAIERLLPEMGVDEGKIIVTDVRGILSRDRRDLEGNPYARAICERTNREQISGGIARAVKGADAVIAVSAPGAVKREHIALMNDDAIVFAMANPVPEIMPEEARGAGAAIVATGRSDFENQINNSLVFPAVFRGVFDVRASRITDEMCISAARALADFAGERGLSRHYIMPRMDEDEAFVREATTVGMEAMREGVARLSFDYDELHSICKEIIDGAKRRIRRR